MHDPQSWHTARSGGALLHHAEVASVHVLQRVVQKRSLADHYGRPNDYIEGLIREDLQRLEQERLEIELMKGLKGKGIPMTPEAWKRMRAEAASRIQAKRSA